MGDDDFARQKVIRWAVEASPRELPETENNQKVIKDLFPYGLEAIQAAGFPQYAQKIERSNHRILVDKLKIPPPLQLKKENFANLVFHHGTSSLRGAKDFMFQLSKEEFASLKSQFVTSKMKSQRGGRCCPPCAFTEEGVAMVSSIWIAIMDPWRKYSGM